MLNLSMLVSGADDTSKCPTFSQILEVHIFKDMFSRNHENTFK